MNKELFEYIKSCPTAYHTVNTSSKMLEKCGFTKLSESREWTLEKGKSYYVTRNNSSIIAFKVPNADFTGFMISAAHSDSPAFKIKENAEIKDGCFAKLASEKYGGMICASWMDRPLSIAGRVVIKTDDGVETRLVDLSRPVAVIPSVAIHMNRNANENASYNMTTDMVPLAGYEEDFSLKKEISDLAGVKEGDIAATDLFLYNPQNGVEWNGMISAPRLDDLQCAFASLIAFCSSEPQHSMPVMCIFDNEEVGSSTKQGAASTFLIDILERISSSLGDEGDMLKRRLASSFIASCDNAHSVHPNHPELSDPSHKVFVNGGIVIKYNANQKYTSDAVSSAIFSSICDMAGVPTQKYANRADMSGGSTLGSIADTKVSVNTVDIGLAELSMHSSFETAGAKDTEYLVRALKSFFECSITAKEDGKYSLN